MALLFTGSSYGTDECGDMYPIFTTPDHEFNEPPFGDCAIFFRELFNGDRAVMGPINNTVGFSDGIGMDAVMQQQPMCSFSIMDSDGACSDSYTFSGPDHAPDTHMFSHHVFDFFAVPYRVPEIQTQTLNKENVENAGRRSRTRAGVKVIYSHVIGQNINENKLVGDVIDYLTALKNSTHYPLFIRKGHKGLQMNEVDNALRTISAPKKSGDYAAIIQGGTYLTLDHGVNMSVKGLLARVWWIITNQYQESQQELLQENLVKSLGQCIEDDDHRVCSNGKTQRIVSVLQGYIDGIEIDDCEEAPAVEAFLKVFFDSNPGLQDVSGLSDAERQNYAQRGI